MKRISIILMCCMLLASNFAFAQNKDIEKKVVFITLGDMDYVADDSLYGRQVINVPEITQSVMDKWWRFSIYRKTSNRWKPPKMESIASIVLSKR